MKKTIITLLAFAGVAMAAQKVSVTPGGDILSGLDDGIINSITTPGNTDYDLEMPMGDVSYWVDEDLYVNSFLAAGKSSISLYFGKNGSITAGHYMNFYSQSTTEWNVELADDALVGLDYGALYERVLLTATGDYYGIWNVGSNDDNTKFAYASFNDIPELSGYTNAGIMNNNQIATLEAGQYALVFTEGGNTDSLKLVVVAVPEPTSAMLSLLAFAGLAARRRR